MNSLRKLLKYPQTLFPAFVEVIAAAPKESLLLFSFLALQGVTPGVFLFGLQAMSSWIFHGQEPTFWTNPLVFFSILGSVFFVDFVLSPLVSALRMNLNEKILLHCNVIIMEKANSFTSLEPFEDEKLYNELQFLKEEARRKPLNFIYVITGIFRHFVSLISILAVLVNTLWWIPFLIVFSSIPHTWAMFYLEKKAWDMALFQSPDVRRMSWVSALTLDERVAKEIRLFGFGDFLVGYYQKIAKAFFSKAYALRSSQCKKAMYASCITVVGHVCTFGLLILLANRGAIPAATLIMLLQALIFMQQELSSFVQDLACLIPTTHFFQKLKEFTQRKTSTEKNTQISAWPMRQGIIFENVSFAYPDGRKALSEVNLKIFPQEKLAIVGENGAGKTTLIKLLLGLYRPTQGRILVDGVDLQDINIISWRKQCSAIFQDFGQFALSVRENIGLGDTQRMESPDIEAAAAESRFLSIARKLPQGFHSLLGKEFGGTTLSTGEWQKLALARAIFPKSSLLIFDEPTAALDPKSEHELFEKFGEISKGKAAIFITHRLASISMTDRIIVMKNGSIIEEGRHSELITNSSEYALLYALQASRYMRIPVPV